MKIVAIAAVAKNGVIGRGSELPWNIPEDMKFFRDSTRDQIVIMGRKTYQALGKALPKRENAVITRDKNFKLNDATVFHDLKSAIDFFQLRDPKLNQNKILFVIGGAEIYALSLPYVNEIWLTEIESSHDGDILFPHYKNGQFSLPGFVRSKETAQKDLLGTVERYRFSVFSRSK